MKISVLRIVSVVLFTLMLMLTLGSLWIGTGHDAKFQDDCLIKAELLKAGNPTIKQTVDWWSMYRHDPQHSGYSTSKAPKSNQTFWIKQFTDWVRCSPAAHEDIVFIGTDENALYAFNASTGGQIWRYNTAGDVTSSPAVAYGRVYVGCEDRKLYCLNKTTGVLKWSFNVGAAVVSSPCVTENKVLFGADNNKMYCLDAITGGHLWNYTTAGIVQSSPAVADGKVFFGSADLKVYALNLVNGAFIWSYTTPSSIITSPSVISGKVYISAFNTMYCLSSSVGGFTWSYTAGGVIHTSPAVSGGNVYFGCNDYKLYCLNALNGQSKWNFTTGGAINSSPAVASGKVYFGSEDKKVYCINATVGAFIWSYNTGGFIRSSSPAVADGFVYVGSSYSAFSGKLFAFGPTNTPPVASNLAITPSVPVTTDDLIGSYDYFDEDGDPESGTEIRWYKNGVLQPTYNDVLLVPSSATVKGQLWYFTVKPKDGKEFGQLRTSPTVTVQNTPPYIEAVTITPDPAYTNDTLVANPSGWFDPDDDPEGYSFQWQKFLSGSWQNIAGATSQTLNPEYFVKEDLIRVLCTPFDGEDYGSQREDSIMISNSPPSIDSYYPTFDPTITEGESQEFNITKSDLDLDLLIVEWFLNRTLVLNGSDSYVYVADFESAGTYNVTVNVSDGTDQTKHEWSLTVKDVVRDIAVTSVTLSRNVVGEGYTVSFNVTLENQGVYSEVFNLTVYADTSVIHMEEISLANGTFKVITFTWNTTGFIKGNYTITACAELVLGETDSSDNTFTNGWVSVTIPGDVDGDFDVDIIDIVRICIAYGSEMGDPNYDTNRDIDGNGEIDIFDVVIAASHYGMKDP